MRQQKNSPQPGKKGATIGIIAELARLPEPEIKRILQTASEQ